MDLPKTFTVQITQEDINMGARHFCAGCPVALAASRQLGVPIRVLTREAGVADDEGAVKWTHKHDASRFIYAFDAGKPVSPRLVTFTKINHRGEC